MHLRPLVINVVRHHSAEPGGDFPTPSATRPSLAMVNWYGKATDGIRPCTVPRQSDGMVSASAT